MNVGHVGGSIPWCIPWCLPMRSGALRGGAPVRTGALRGAPRRHRGGASAHRCDPPRGSSGRVGPAAARLRAHWPDFNRDCAAEAPVRTSALHPRRRLLIARYAVLVRIHVSSLSLTLHHTTLISPVVQSGFGALDLEVVGSSASAASSQSVRTTAIDYA